MKIYTDKNTGEQVQIVSEAADYYVLNNKASIKKNIFLNKYEEAIDPSAFLNSRNTSADPLMNLANQIKNMDTARMSNEDTATRIKYKPAQVLSDDSRTETRVAIPQIEDTDGIVLSDQQRKQVIEKWMREHPNMPVPETVNFKENARGEIEYEILKGQVIPIDRMDIPKVDTSMNGAVEFEKPTIPQQGEALQTIDEPKQDPLQTLLKMFKSTYPISILINIDEMIPKPTFLSDIMENVNVDIIDYYAKIITEKFLKDTVAIKKEIYTQLKDIIDKELNGSPVKKTTLKRTTLKKKQPPKLRKKQQS